LSEFGSPVKFLVVYVSAGRRSTFVKTCRAGLPPGGTPGLSSNYQPVGGEKLGGLVPRVKLAALSASKAGASPPAIKRNPSKTLEKEYLGDALRLTHNLNDPMGGS